MEANMTIAQTALVAEYACKMGLSYSFSEALYRRLGEQAFQTAVQY